MNHWLFSIEPRRSGEDNMARDAAIAEACRGDGVPRLRLYSWEPWALSLGHNQDESQVDRAALERAGCQLVRRPTGGRAVFHAEELTYGVAMPASGEGVHETYARISEALRLGLAGVGAGDVEFARSQPDFRAHYEKEDSASCFSASALNELSWRGRKLVGSAQRRYGSVLLQHGSLLIGPAHLEIVDFLFSSAAPERRQALKERLASRTATLTEMLPHSAPTFEQLARSIVTGFAMTFEATLVPCDEITRITNPADEQPALP
jgi:lipoyl(octanoyl) transferase